MTEHPCPEEVTDVIYSQRFEEYLVITDEFAMAVKNTGSIVEERDSNVIGELPVPIDIQDSVECTWDDLSSKSQKDVKVYIDNVTTKKGQRNEREATNILGRIRGSGNVSKVNSYSNHDPFGFVDIMAIGSYWDKILFVQVKTNSFTSKERNKYLRKMQRLNFDNSRFEVWVRVDYEGWKIYEYNPQEKEFELVLEMDTTDTEETVEELREREGYYEQYE